MAKPIKLTPVLKGDDAVRFHSTINNNRTKAVSNATLLEIRKSAEQLLRLVRNK